MTLKKYILSENIKNRFPDELTLFDDRLSKPIYLRMLSFELCFFIKIRFIQQWKLFQVPMNCFQAYSYNTGIMFVLQTFMDKLNRAITLYQSEKLTVFTVLNNIDGHFSEY